ARRVRGLALARLARSGASVLLAPRAARLRIGRDRAVRRPPRPRERGARRRLDRALVGGRRQLARVDAGAARPRRQAARPGTEAAPRPPTEAVAGPGVPARVPEAAWCRAGGRGARPRARHRLGV